MLTHRRDRTCSPHPICAPLYQRQHQSYYAEVPAQPLDEQCRLIEQLIGLAFDTLGVCHLDVRVIAADRGSIDACAQFDAW